MDLLRQQQGRYTETSTSFSRRQTGPRLQSSFARNALVFQAKISIIYGHARRQWLWPSILLTQQEVKVI